MRFNATLANMSGEVLGAHNVMTVAKCDPICTCIQHDLQAAEA